MPDTRPPENYLLDSGDVYVGLFRVTHSLIVSDSALSQMHAVLGFSRLKVIWVLHSWFRYISAESCDGSFPGAILNIVADFNRLDMASFLYDMGLEQMVANK